jgi:tRNA (mo5U34)-methyltransferase
VLLTKRARLQAAADQLLWFHSHDLGSGVRTAGIKSAETLQREWEVLSLPALEGKSVLDIGAWDGWFSFRCEEAGAKRVVALDHYAWALDHAAQRKYFLRCLEEGVTPEEWENVPELWDETLPGKRPFDLVHRHRRSRVEAVVRDFPTADASDLEAFDIVLFLGVLYHLRDPFLALRRVAKVTRELAVIETVCMVVPGQEHHPLWELFPTDELADDPTNWWAGNAKGIESMCRAAGFGRVEYKSRPLETDPPAEGHDYHYGRAILYAYK